MGYQSKTYSLSDEVIDVLEQYKDLGVTPNRLLTVVLIERRQFVPSSSKLLKSSSTSKAIGEKEKK